MAELSAKRKFWGATLISTVWRSIIQSMEKIWEWPFPSTISFEDKHSIQQLSSRMQKCSSILASLHSNTNLSQATQDFHQLTQAMLSTIQRKEVKLWRREN